MFHEQNAISRVLYPSKAWERFGDQVYSILKLTHLEKFFYHFNNLYQNIKFTMEGESNGELPFLETLLQQNNGKISVLVYRESTHADQTILHTAALTTKQVVRGVFFPLCLIGHIPSSPIRMN